MAFLPENYLPSQNLKSISSSFIHHPLRTFFMVHWKFEICKLTKIKSQKCCELCCAMANVYCSLSFVFIGKVYAVVRFVSTKTITTIRVQSVESNHKINKLCFCEYSCERKSEWENYSQRFDVVISNTLSFVHPKPRSIYQWLCFINSIRNGQSDRFIHSWSTDEMLYIFQSINPDGKQVCCFEYFTAEIERE